MMTAIFGWPLLALGGWLMALRKSNLPASLWIWRTDAPWLSAIVTTAALVAGLEAVSMLLTGFLGGPYWAIPEAFLWLYCVAITRAAALSSPMDIGTSAPRTFCQRPAE
jgi:hypothetical protein